MFSYLTTMWKALVGFLCGLGAVIVLSIIQVLRSYQPVACSATVTENCTPQIIIAAYTSIIPLVVGLLTGLVNWLKYKNK